MSLGGLWSTLLHLLLFASSPGLAAAWCGGGSRTLPLPAGAGSPCPFNQGTSEWQETCQGEEEGHRRMKTCPPLRRVGGGEAEGREGGFNVS